MAFLSLADGIAVICFLPFLLFLLRFLGGRKLPQVLDQAALASQHPRRASQTLSSPKNDDMAQLLAKVEGLCAYINRLEADRDGLRDAYQLADERSRREDAAKVIRARYDEQAECELQKVCAGYEAKLHGAIRSLEARLASDRQRIVADKQASERACEERLRHLEEEHRAMIGFAEVKYAEVVGERNYYRSLAKQAEKTTQSLGTSACPTALSTIDADGDTRMGDAVSGQHIFISTTEMEEITGLREQNRQFAREYAGLKVNIAQLQLEGEELLKENHLLRSGTFGANAAQWQGSHGVPALQREEEGPLVARIAEGVPMKGGEVHQEVGIRGGAGLQVITGPSKRITLPVPNQQESATASASPAL
ncbi:hypothetical protein N7532_008513 [Penicillium argentinense]|uniref:Uncharacterized protein n=1 Tax=Penicillium argentinense TaxID=1131581 RepID=A0A9W9EXR6_9EURO|nr:uncharacterized protein N7532_008513 [Penicillium argentinense]KAJ5089829.1 hypothetical protein N7532_008513 [Penicillium argentinense]